MAGDASCSGSRRWFRQSECSSASRTSWRTAKSARWKGAAYRTGGPRSRSSGWNAKHSGGPLKNGRSFRRCLRFGASLQRSVPRCIRDAFIISRRFSDEFVAKTRVKELEQEVITLMGRVEEYRQRVAELMARQQKMIQ